MHDYTVWQFHNDRTRELTRDADASRLAAIAKDGQPRRNPRALLHKLSVGLTRLSRHEWRPQQKANAAGPESGATTALSVSSAGER